MAEAVLGRTLRASALAHLVVTARQMIGLSVTFGLARIMFARAGSRGPRLIVHIHAEGSRDHYVPVDVGRRLRPNRATDLCRHRPDRGPSWSVSASRSSERSTRISSMSSRITFARIVFSPPNPSAS